MKIQLEIKEDCEIRDLHPLGVATWPHPGHRKAAFSRLSLGGKGSVFSPYLLTSLPSGFLPIKGRKFTEEGPKISLSFFF